MMIMMRRISQIAREMIERVRPAVATPRPIVLVRRARIETINPTMERIMPMAKQMSSTVPLPVKRDRTSRRLIMPRMSPRGDAFFCSRGMPGMAYPDGPPAYIAY